MGVQFWWFYDVIVIAVAAICIFITAKKGLLKASFAIVGYIFAVFLSYSGSAGIADTITEHAIRGSNIQKLHQTLVDYEYSSELAMKLEGLGYNLYVDRSTLEEIYSKGEDVDEKIYDYLNKINNKKVDEEDVFYEKLHNCYAESVKGLISRQLTQYSAECAAEEIRKDPATFRQFLQIVSDPEHKEPGAVFLVDHYLMKPYRTYVRLIIYLIAFVLLLFLALVIARAAARHDHIEYNAMTYISCGIIGIAKAATIVLAIAVMIRLYVITGSNKMLFFNHDVIEKSYIFKYIYQIVQKW